MSDFDRIAYIREDININFKVPVYVQEYIDIINEGIQNKDLDRYSEGVDSMDHLAKMAAIQGCITDYQCTALRKKWGLQMSVLDSVIKEASLPDISNWEINYGANYTGRSCTKAGLFNPQGIKYMVKIEDNIKEKILNAGLSYSNTPITEHLGCKIFDTLGIKVQSTFLCSYKGKMAVACKDFTTTEKQLVEYSQFKLNNPEFNEYSSTNALSNDFVKQIEFLDRFSAKYFNIKERFWRTFILDALIGNGDRTDNNQAFLGSYKGLSLAPVYDCGAGLNPNWSLDKMQKFLDTDDKSMYVHKARTCCYTIKDKLVNPYKVIREGVYEDCKKALIWFLDNSNNLDFEKIVNHEVLFASQVQKDFYVELLKERLEFLISCY